MARPGVSKEDMQRLNELILRGLTQEGDAARQTYLAALDIDDGIAEANFQLGRIYLQEGKVAEAREHFWKANDRDIVLKRLPSAFHDISRAFVQDNAFPYLDVNQFFE